MLIWGFNLAWLLYTPSLVGEEKRDIGLGYINFESKSIGECGIIL